MTTDINIVNLIVLFTSLWAIARLDGGNERHRLVLMILFLMLATEIFYVVARHAGLHAGRFVTFAAIIHNVLWLYTLSRVYRDRLIAVAANAIFLGFAVVNYAFLEGWEVFNYNTFIVGSLIYLLLLLNKSFLLLRREQLDFFLTNDYVLAGIPVPLFFGLSLVFAFKDLHISQYKIVGDITLYQFLISVVNLCYYSMILLYIRNENKLNRAG